MACNGSRVLLLAAWMGLLGPGLSMAAGASGYARCEEQFAAHPQERESARCFYLEVGKGGAREQAVRRLRELLAANPRNPWLQFYSAELEESLQDRAEELFRSAAGEFQHRDANGELLARYNLVETLLNQGRTDEAGPEVEREATAARSVAPPASAHDLALAKISRARLLLIRGAFKDAGLLLDEVPAAFRDQFWLAAANTVHTETGQLDRSWDECLKLSQPTFDHFTRAGGFWCQARVLVERTAELPGGADRRLIEQAARAAIVEAEAGDNRMVAARAHWLLAMLAPSADAARKELVRCLDSASGDADRRLCSRALGRFRAPAGAAPSGPPQGAAPGAELDDPVSRAQALGDRMRESWRSRPFDDFVGDAQKALAEIEQLRAQQAGSEVQAGLFSTWSADYYWFSGRLLEAALAGRCPSCLDLAFGVIERLRARTLRDVLVAAETGAAAPLSEVRLAALHRAIERVARRRQDRFLPASERENAESDLRQLSAEEERLQRSASGGAARSPATAAPSPSFATLSEVQARLAPDEAVLSFQVAPWQDWTGDFGGGSWLVAATRSARRCYRLEEMGRGNLRQAVAELVEHRQYPRSWQLTGLYRLLLGPALSALPPGIDRLIIIPDDHLHRLPFAALRSAPDGRPIAWRYQISIIPSATLWAHWKLARRPPAAERPALVLADPPPPAPEVQKAFQAGGINLPTEPLPAARREADTLVRYLGRGCERLVGDAVSEAALLDSRRDLRRFALVHFAAHSIVDDRDPRRSGIWLSPSPGRDGLLQAADIVRLRFDDRLVVLSTCSSNGGLFLRGEGVMSLAHAFFQARARTVVASLWPQADTDAAVLFAAFYRHLGQGATVAAALRLAQLDLLRREPRLPPAAWAGMVVLGDGNLVPFPGGLRSGVEWWRVALSGAVAAAVFAGLRAWRSRRARRITDTG